MKSSQALSGSGCPSTASGDAINGHVEAARATTSYAELTAYRYGASHAVADSINSQIQAAIVRPWGFQSLRSYTHIIFLTTGKLQNHPANPCAQPVTL